jgi:hypothetical protein
MSHLYQISLSCVIGHQMCHRRLPTTDFQWCWEGRDFQWCWEGRGREGGRGGQKGLSPSADIFAVGRRQKHLDSEYLVCGCVLKSQSAWREPAMVKTVTFSMTGMWSGQNGQFKYVYSIPGEKPSTSAWLGCVSIKTISFSMSGMCGVQNTSFCMSGMLWSKSSDSACL